MPAKIITNVNNATLPTQINFDSRFPINGRHLHMMLAIATPYHKWMPRMIEYGFSENADFTTTDKIVHREDGVAMPQKQIDHQLTIDMAKHICMIQRSEIGKKIRQYLIDVENQWNFPEAIMQRALEIAHKKNEELKARISLMAPKVQVFDEIAVSKDLISWHRGCSVIRKIEKIPMNENQIRDFLVSHLWLSKELKLEGGFKYRIRQHIISNGFMVYAYDRGYDGKPKLLKWFTGKGLEELVKLIKLERNKKQSI